MWSYTENSADTCNVFVELKLVDTLNYLMTTINDNVTYRKLFSILFCQCDVRAVTQVMKVLLHMKVTFLTSRKLSAHQL